MNRDELIVRAAADRNVSAGTDADEIAKVLQGSGVTTGDLSRVEYLLGLPQDSLLAPEAVHRQVTYQNWISPRGFEKWAVLLSQFFDVLTLESGGPTAMAKFRGELETQLENKVLALWRGGKITAGRAREILQISPWDDLEKEIQARQSER